METQIIVYKDSGVEAGSVLLTIDFTAKTWTVVNDPRGAWPGTGKTGPIEIPVARQMSILDGAPGRLTPIIVFNDFPTSESETGSAGVGKVVSGGYVFVARTSPQLSEIRFRMLQIVDKVQANVSSKLNGAVFQDLTNLTQKVLEEHWDGKHGQDKLYLTSCNAFLGKTAQRLGASPGSWLGKGVLDLQRCDKDVPGSYFYAKKHPGKRPQAGDFYCVGMINQKGDFQEYGHVGVVAQVNKDGTWVSVDGGQGGRTNREDFVKRVPRGSLADFKFTGWCDIDIYFAGK